MKTAERKQHWENIYTSKNLTEVSWYQPVPVTTLQFMQELGIQKKARIIDVGGGDSLLADHLLNLGYEDITVLDISEKALGKAKARLGDKADRIKWIVADAASFVPTEKYDFWHDRATFHFLSDQAEIHHYAATISEHLNPGGSLLLGTFSEEGPAKCSGIPVKQYSTATITESLKHWFQKIKCLSVDHPTPSGSIQNFIFCSFKKLLPAA